MIKNTIEYSGSPDCLDLEQGLAAILREGVGVAINIGGTWVTATPDEVLVWSASNDTLWSASNDTLNAGGAKSTITERVEPA